MSLSCVLFDFPVPRRAPVSQLLTCILSCRSLPPCWVAALCLHTRNEGTSVGWVSPACSPARGRLYKCDELLNSSWGLTCEKKWPWLGPAHHLWPSEPFAELFLKHQSQRWPCLGPDVPDVLPPSMFVVCWPQTVSSPNTVTHRWTHRDIRTGEPPPSWSSVV